MNDEMRDQQSIDRVKNICSTDEKSDQRAHDVCRQRESLLFMPQRRESRRMFLVRHFSCHRRSAHTLFCFSCTPNQHTHHTPYILEYLLFTLSSREQQRKIPRNSLWKGRRSSREVDAESRKYRKASHEISVTSRRGTDNPLRLTPMKLKIQPPMAPPSVRKCYREEWDHIHPTISFPWNGPRAIG